MSSAYPKPKEKRPRTSSEPNISFVKNVTSKMSGLLPATIKKWFSSPSASNTNGSAQAEATDSSTEDEAPESPVTTQPPAKRMRYSSPVKYIQLLPVETTNASTNTESTTETYTVHSLMGRDNLRQEKHFMSSTSHSANDDTDQTSQSSSFHKSQHSITSKDNSVSKIRKSLFGISEDEHKKKYTSNRSVNVRDPHFKPSLLSSPFYAGRTMYGGAAASSYVSPSIKQRKISSTNERSNNDNVTMSQSARHVLDLLEQCSSPLVEARRIPRITREPKSVTNSSPQLNTDNLYDQTNPSHKYHELYVPSVASILTIKRKSRLMETTNIARQIIASHSSSSEFVPYPKVKSSGVPNETSGDKLIPKIKSKLTRKNREQNFDMDDKSDTINLPTGVLQIDKDNLPKFTFGSNMTSTPLPSKSSSIQTPVIITPEAFKRNAEADKLGNTKSDESDSNKPIKIIATNEQYKFSTPVQLFGEPNKSSSTAKFNFECPETNVDKVQELKKIDNQFNSSISNQTNASQSASESICAGCGLKNKIDANNCICCKKTKEDKNTSKNLIETDKPKIMKELNSAKWKCNDCWVENNETDNNCVCCGAVSSKKKTSVKATVINSADEKLESDWKCDDCWIKNKSTLDKCAACGQCKPQSKPISLGAGTGSDTGFKFGITASQKLDNGDTKVAEPSDSTFKNIAKAQDEKWKCPVCLVRNDNNSATCCCCETEKPGTVKENKSKFNFHQTSEITFKFGIQPSKQDITIETDKSMQGEVVNETNNNIIPKTPTFNFGLPLKNSGEQQPYVAEEKSTNAPKINFKFGVKNIKDLTNLNTNFAPSNFSESKIIREEEKPQEVPQVITTNKIDELPKKIVSLFNTQNAQDMPVLVPLNPNSDIKEDDILYTKNPVIPVSSETKARENTFKFVPSTSLFATSSVTATPQSSILPVALAPSTPAASAVSLFQKADAATTAASFFNKNDALPVTVSLFPNTATTTSVTATASLGTTPLFSFGSQNQVSSAQPTKPQFNFSFKSNVTETSSPFKLTFGASNDSNVSNKFNLPSNTMTGGNTLQVNTTTQMYTANSLTTGNSITTTQAPSIFGNTVQKENMWSTSNNNMFATNATTNVAQKPPAFTFGAAVPFNANATLTSFGNTTQPAPATQTPQNVFGITNQATTTQPSMFTSPLQSQTTTNIFGSQQAPTNPMPMGIFGTPNAAVAPAFGNSNPPIPTFETSRLAPVQVSAPAFNFGSQQPAGIFGFGQQQVPQADGQPGNPAQPALFGTSFGAAAPVTPQFSIGAAPNTGVRRVRKAMRRTQR